MVLKYIYLCSLIPDAGGPPKHVESLMNMSPVVHSVGILQYYTFLHCHNVLQNYRPFYKLDVHGSVHHNTNLIEMTNKMQLCRRIYYSIIP